MRDMESRSGKERGGFRKRVMPAIVIATVTVVAIVMLFCSVRGRQKGSEAETLMTDGSAETAGMGQSEVQSGQQSCGEDVLRKDMAAGIGEGGTGSAAGNTDTSGELSDITVGPERYDISLCFAGDICFDDTCAVMQNYISQGERLENNISPELLQIMNEADICWVNNEFAYSDRGQPLENKMYTFRATPGRGAMLQEMGVDIAGLANNHVYDFGAEAMEDTLDTLREAGIDYVGAGKNLAEAMTPVYREVDGKRIAYVAASRAEKFKMTPQATEEEAGILRCYDTELFLEEIRQARQQADYVIALVHWGTEYSTELEEVQIATGREYIDAGADIVIGAHTHCLQGMEFYQGKPIIYSLGNFWFNDKSLDSMLLQVRLSGEDRTLEIAPENVEVQIVPAKQENCVTRMLDGEEADGLFDYLEGLSAGLEIDEEGVVLEVH